MIEPAIIVAMTHERTIGNHGDLPWRYREDLRHFKQMTMGHTLIMGRKTWDSIGRPLPGRQSIVLSRNPDFKAPGAICVGSWTEAINMAKKHHDPTPFIIGGSSIYAAALQWAKTMHITYIDQYYVGNVFFPKWDKHQWIETHRRQGKTPELQFVRYARRAVLRQQQQ